MISQRRSPLMPSLAGLSPHGSRVERPMPTPDEIAHQFEVRVKQECTDDRAYEIKTCVVKKGPQAYKRVALRTFADPATGELKKREFTAQTWGLRKDGVGFAFEEKPSYSWRCENDEVEALRRFLDQEMDTAGQYRLIRGGSDFETLLSQVEAGEINGDDLARLVGSAKGTAGFLEAMARSETGQLLAEAVEVQHRRDALAEFRELIEDPHTTERQLHAFLKGQTWIFGGRYIGEAARQRLTTEDVLDIPLLQADGALHVVELKKAAVARLVEQPRSHLIVGPEVHEAVSQAINYLRSLDEQRDTVLANFKTECRRSFATVLIGHPMHARDGRDPKEIADAFRTYNSHLARVEVMTYRELVDSAERALNFVEPEEDAPEPGPDPWTDGDPWGEPPF